MNHSTGASRTTSSRAWTTSLAVAAACAASLSSALSAHALTPPPVPGDIEVPADAKLFRIEHAVGTQNYVCVATQPDPEADPVYAWVPFGPQATLFNDHDRQTATHFLSANPVESGTLRPTWQDSRDTSTIWAKPVAQSEDSAYVEPGAIPWLRLDVVGWQHGPTEGNKILRSAYLQRINTSGGLKPTTGCSEQEHIGARKLVPYTADYLFYKSSTKAA